MGTETWIISLPLSDSILYLKIIHPPNFREEPNFLIEKGAVAKWLHILSQPPSFIFLLKFSCFAESAEVFFGSFRIDDAAWP